MTAVLVTGLPLVTCTSWCDQQDGHPDAGHVDDQWCGSAELRVDLTREPLVIGPDDGPNEYRTREYMGAYLQRSPLEVEATINLSKGEVRGVTLTLGEARRLGEALIELSATGAR